MEDWYVGQKIVCIDVAAQPPFKTPPKEVVEHLRLGEIYTIAEIGIYNFSRAGEKVAFRLVGIDSDIRFEIPTIGVLIKEYMFWSGRFRPLETLENLESLVKDVDKWIDPVHDNDEIEEKNFKPKHRKKKVKEPEHV